MNEVGWAPGGRRDPAADGARRGVWGIVLAAGRGTRFGGAKQFHTLHGRPLVDHVVQVAAAVCEGLVVVLPPGVAWAGPPVARTVAGGETRSSSVRAGLAAVPDGAEIVVVHDAAHPLAGRSLFAAVIAAVRGGADAALPALPLNDPVKWADSGRVVGTVPASGAVLVQVPHAFRAPLLRALHADAPEPREDTELVERHGGSIAVVPGDPCNLHVTTAAELDLVTRISATSGPAQEGAWASCAGTDAP